jgi:hypothetical protein
MSDRDRLLIGVVLAWIIRVMTTIALKICLDEFVSPETFESSAAEIAELVADWGRQR